LDFCEAGYASDLLRFWESPKHFVVLGYANKSSTEVDQATCCDFGIPLLRRCSGGGTVLQGPGCLNYSLILGTNAESPLKSIPGTNQFILTKHQAALSKLLTQTVQIQGQTDLSLDQLKFSGNAQRRKKRSLLYHGTFLLGLDFTLMGKILPLPSKQPDYRANRSHSDFLINLELEREVLKATLRECWQAKEPLTELPLERIEALAREKYETEEWNLRF